MEGLFLVIYELCFNFFSVLSILISIRHATSKTTRKLARYQKSGVWDCRYEKYRQTFGGVPVSSLSIFDFMLYIQRRIQLQNYSSNNVTFAHALPAKRSK